MPNKSLLEYLQSSDDYAGVSDLFSKSENGREFEIIFSKSLMTSPINREMYINFLKYFNYRADNDKLPILETKGFLDVILSNDEVVYRCTIENEYLEKYLKNLENHRSHVIFRTLVKLIQKGRPGIHLLKKTREKKNTYDIPDFGLRVRVSDEDEVSKEEMDMLSEINETYLKKIKFRFKQRTTLVLHGTFNSEFEEAKENYVKIDLTFTKTSNRYKQLNFNPPNFELEVEYKPIGKVNKDILNLMISETEKLLKIVQQSQYLISVSEQKEVLAQYRQMLVIGEDKFTLSSRQPISLEIEYLPNTLPNKYAVADKTDGERTFMMIIDNHVYFINNNLVVKNTGIELSKKLSVFNNTITDGELVFVNEKKRFLYVMFDCLVYQGNDIRRNPSLMERQSYCYILANTCFKSKDQLGMPSGEVPITTPFNLNAKLEHHRRELIQLMNNIDHDLNIDRQYPLIRCKYFIGATGALDWEIFSYACLINEVYKDPNIKVPYATDGLIFQPLIQAYTFDKGPNVLDDYKWKPSTSNSIDFYIEFMKDQNGNIMKVYDNSFEDFTRNKLYQICKLHVGRTVGSIESPIPFREHENLHLAYLFVEEGEPRDMYGNVITDKTVVEFYYDTTPGIMDRFRWVPMRTRYDKTEQVVKYHRRYGNYHTTAESVWRSIINPVQMKDFEELAKGNDPANNSYIYDELMNKLRRRIVDETAGVKRPRDTSYDARMRSLVYPMNTFHNWVRSNVVYTYGNPQYVKVHRNDKTEKQMWVLDIGCGRGIELMKFYYNEVKGYVGIDTNVSALNDPLNGAISVYNKNRKKPDFPNTFFFNLDATVELDLESQKNVIGVKRIENEKYVPRFFSKDPKKRVQFDRLYSSFSLEYMLDNETGWNNFKKNVKNYLKDNGFFIVFTYDSDKVREILKGREEYVYEYLTESNETKPLFRLIKRYEEREGIMGIGNMFEIHMAWYHRLETDTEALYLVDTNYIVPEFHRDCDLELVDTNNLYDYFNIHQSFFDKTYETEEKEETKNFFANAAKYYNKNDPINRGCYEYTKLLRFYVFRKRSNFNQTGGADDIVDFTDTNKFVIAELDNKYYSPQHTFIDSIHHLLKSKDLIPKTLKPKKLCRDLGIKYVTDEELTTEIMKDILNRMVISHIEEDHRGKQKEIRVLNGLNLFIAERDCNDFYEVNFVGKRNRPCGVLIKTDNGYRPVYIVDNDVGIFEPTHELVQKLKEEL